MVKSASENSPYVEALNVTLLDQQFEVLDPVGLSKDMMPGFFKDIEIIDNKRHFFQSPDPYVFQVETRWFFLPVAASIRREA